MSTNKGLVFNTGDEVAVREEEGVWTQMFDEAEKPLFLEVPDGEGVKKLPVEFLIIGTYSKTYRRRVIEMKDRLARVKRKKVSGKMIDEHQILLDAACVRGWRNVVSWPQGPEGEPKQVPWSEDNTEVLLRQSPWLAEQVNDVANDHEVFSKSASQS
jgi:hypothetical protein